MLARDAVQKGRERVDHLSVGSIKFQQFAWGHRIRELVLAFSPAMRRTMSDNGAGRTLDTVLAIAVQVGGGELTAESDLIAAGFDSIAIIELATRLTDEFGVPCDIDDVFDATSVAELAAVLDGRLEGARAR